MMQDRGKNAISRSLITFCDFIELFHNRISEENKCYVAVRETENTFNSPSFFFFLRITGEPPHKALTSHVLLVCSEVNPSSKVYSVCACQILSHGL